ncbi:hypothetical protein [Micromonospora sp. CPCC 205558]|uniref:hypothetical protein n=1 Tax=Micromonospora sp. CPCC 205558 TaxID=3122403 RepID=UPI002FF273BC
MRRQRWVLVGGIFAACAVIVTVLFLRFAAPGGAASPEAAVADYVTALHDRDRGKLADLADPGTDSSAEISRRLTELGGGRLVVSDRRFDTTASDAEVRATISGRLDGSPYSDVIWLRRIDDAWFVALRSRAA